VSGIVTPVRDAGGHLIGFSKVMRDMTERNKLTEERDAGSRCARTVGSDSVWQLSSFWCVSSQAL
jgi:hypothetical protein